MTPLPRQDEHNKNNSSDMIISNNQDGVAKGKNSKQTSKNLPLSISEVRSRESSHQTNLKRMGNRNLRGADEHRHTEYELRNSAHQKRKQQKLVGGKNFGQLISEKSDSSVAISEQEHAEEAVMMKQAVNELFGEDSYMTEKLLDKGMRENRLHLLRKQLVGPDIDHVSERFDIKLGMMKEEVQKMV